MTERLERLRLQRNRLAERKSAAAGDGDWLAAHGLADEFDDVDDLYLAEIRRVL